MRLIHAKANADHRNLRREPEPRDWAVHSRCARARARVGQKGGRGEVPVVHRCDLLLLHFNDREHDDGNYLVDISNPPAREG